LIHLCEVSLPDRTDYPARFPFHLPVIQSLETLTFSSEVTFFVGENGSGKSTVLEAIACAADLPTVGSDRISNDPTLAAVRALSEYLRWSWTKRTRRGFFMRSEDFFGYVKHIAQTRQNLADDLERVDDEMSSRSELARKLARMPFTRELSALDNSYGAGLDAQSHGESYFKLFRSRFVPNGLYLLDEPEAPLSPNSQLSLLTMLHLMVKQGAQFIIATHSPIILAYPDATILSFDGERIEPVNYESLEHVTVMRTFLNNPDAYLNHLLD
jgi:predicted ATPase